MKSVIDSHLANGSLFTLLNELWYFGLHSSGTSPSPVPWDFLVHNSVFIRNFLLIWQRDLKFLSGGAGEEARRSEEAERARRRILDGRRRENRKEMMMNLQWVFHMSHSQPCSPRGVRSERISTLYGRRSERCEAEPSRRGNEDGEDGPSFPSWFWKSSSDFFSTLLEEKLRRK